MPKRSRRPAGSGAKARSVRETQVLRAVIIGDVNYRKFNKLERVMRHLTAGRGVQRVVFIIPDQRGVGAQAVTICHALGTQFIHVPKLQTYRTNAEPFRNNFLLRELKPHVVLFFAEDLYVQHLAGAKDLADKADSKGIKVVHYK